MSATHLPSPRHTPRTPRLPSVPTSISAASTTSKLPPPHTQNLSGSNHTLVAMHTGEPLYQRPKHTQHSDEKDAELGLMPHPQPVQAHLLPTRPAAASPAIPFELLQLTTPHRPPVTPLQARPNTSSGVTSTAIGWLNSRTSNGLPVDPASARLASMISLTSSPRAFIASQKELDKYLAEQHSPEDYAQQIRFLHGQAAARELELSVLRRESNTYKDSEVEKVMSELDRLRNQLRLAEEDISTLLSEKRLALKSATGFRRQNDALEARASRAEGERTLAEKYAKQALEQLEAQTREMAQLAVSMQEQERTEAGLQASLREKDLAQRALQKEHNRLRIEYEQAQSQITSLHEHRRAMELDAATFATRMQELNDSLASAVAHADSETKRAEEECADKARTAEKLLKETTRSSKLEQELESAATREKTSKDRITSLSTQVNALSGELAVTQSQLETLRSESIRTKVSAATALRLANTECDRITSALHAKEEELQTMETTWKQEKLRVKEGLERERLLTVDLARKTEQWELAEDNLKRANTGLENTQGLLASTQTTLKATQQTVEEQKASLRDLQAQLATVSDNLASKQTDLAHAKNQISELRNALGQLQLQHERALKSSADEIAHLRLELAQKHEQILATREAKERAEERQAAAEEERREAVEKCTQAEKDLQEEKSANEKTAIEHMEQYTRLESLYTSTVSSTAHFTEITQKERDEQTRIILEQKGQIELLQAHLISHKHDIEMLQQEHERLVASHRMVNATSLGEHRKLVEAETRIGELERANAQLMQSKQDQQNRSENKRASYGGRVSSPSTTDGEFVDSALSAFLSPAVTKRSSLTSGQMTATLVADAMAASDLKKTNAALQASLDELHLELDGQRKKGERLYEQSEAWRGKYEEQKRQYDELLGRTPHRASMTGVPANWPAGQKTVAHSDAAVAAIANGDFSAMTTTSPRAVTTTVAAPAAPTIDPPPVPLAFIPVRPSSAALRILQSLPLAVGLLFAPANANPALGLGVTVTSVKPQQAAELCGIQPGDVIFHLNGRPTNSKAEFLLALKGLRPGDVIDVEGKRGDAKLQLKMTVGGRDTSAAEVQALRSEAGI